MSRDCRGRKYATVTEAHVVIKTIDRCPAVVNDAVTLKDIIARTLGTMDEGAMRVTVGEQDPLEFYIRPDIYTTFFLLFFLV